MRPSERCANKSSGLTKTKGVPYVVDKPSSRNFRKDESAKRYGGHTYTERRKQQTLKLFS